MRLYLPLAALALLAMPAYAQTTPPAAAPAPASAPAPKAAAPVAHPHLTMEQRFANANTTHDGHLTADQAKAGYPTVARHFEAIDVAKKGFITEDDIHAWEKVERERRHEAQQKATTTPNKS